MCSRTRRDMRGLSADMRALVIGGSLGGPAYQSALGPAGPQYLSADGLSTTHTH
ncbi:hypothetical protein MAUB_05430 [Mycolicibacterium aubagnense]|uniref:Uncharacterized protein n=1 Tax=Mycolicibacterium aubagnense TaxID=319707 RepID=A0ABN5YLR9_9MYCO|nr:hypothetical protein MAUB_05430 [Mycolicibacterium aubagnense]